MWVSGASGPTTCSSMQVFSTHITLLGSSSSSSSDSSLLLELLDSLRLFFAFFFLDFLDLLGNSLLSLSVPSCVNDAAFYSRLWTLTFCSSFSFSSSLFLLLKDKNTRSADEYKNTLLSFLKIMWRWTHHLNLIPGRCPQSAFCSFSSWISSFSFSSSSLLWMTDNILLLTQTTEFCWYFKVFIALWFIWYLLSVFSWLCLGFKAFFLLSFLFLDDAIKASVYLSMFTHTVPSELESELLFFSSSSTGVNSSELVEREEKDFYQSYIQWGELPCIFSICNT